MAAPTVRRPLGGVHPRMVAMKGEAVGNPVASPDAEALGRDIAQALHDAGYTPQAAAFAMGYRDESTLNRWTRGVETPKFQKLFALPRFRKCFVFVQAGHCDGLVIRRQIEETA